MDYSDEPMPSLCCMSSKKLPLTSRSASNISALQQFSHEQSYRYAVGCHLGWALVTPFLTLCEACAMRLVSRTMKAQVAALPWDDTTVHIHSAFFYRCIPAAVRIRVSVWSPSLTIGSRQGPMHNLQTLCADGTNVTSGSIGYAPCLEYISISNTRNFESWAVAHLLQQSTLRILVDRSILQLSSTVQSSQQDALRERCAMYCRDLCNPYVASNRPSLMVCPVCSIDVHNLATAASYPLYNTNTCTTDGISSHVPGISMRSAALEPDLQRRRKRDSSHHDPPSNSTDKAPLHKITAFSSKLPKTWVVLSCPVATFSISLWEQEWAPMWKHDIRGFYNSVKTQRWEVVQSAVESGSLDLNDGIAYLWTTMMRRQHPFVRVAWQSSTECEEYVLVSEQAYQSVVRPFVERLPRRIARHFRICQELTARLESEIAISLTSQQSLLSASHCHAQRLHWLLATTAPITPDVGEITAYDGRRLLQSKQ